MFMGDSLHRRRRRVMTVASLTTEAKLRAMRRREMAVTFLLQIEIA